MEPFAIRHSPFTTPSPQSEIPNPKSEITLILGGARSGKSAFAQKLAQARGGSSVLFVATAEALDEDMAARIARHRAARPAAWQTLEVPRGIAQALARLVHPPRVILLDCLTLWVSNELLAGGGDAATRIGNELEAMLQWQRTHEVDLILVSNEVGLGIVPDNALARTFRDVLGTLNQRAAQAAQRVYWMVAGLPLEIKAYASVPT